MGSEHHHSGHAGGTCEHGRPSERQGSCSILTLCRGRRGGRGGVRGRARRATPKGRRRGWPLRRAQPGGGGRRGRDRRGAAVVPVNASRCHRRHGERRSHYQGQESHVSPGRSHASQLLHVASFATRMQSKKRSKRWPCTLKLTNTSAVYMGGIRREQGRRIGSWNGKCLMPVKMRKVHSIGRP